MSTALAFFPDGSLATGAINPAGLSPECVRAGKAALLLATQSWGAVVTPDEREPVLVVLDRDALACADESGIDRRQRSKQPASLGVIQAPKKTRNVNPVYPPRAQEQSVQGVVILEATITPTGCVANVEVLRSVHPALDFSAIDAVLGWRYTPTLLDGMPVPVIMTVTVNFALHP